MHGQNHIKNEVTFFYRNIRNYLPGNTASHPRILGYSAIPLGEPNISQAYFIQFTLWNTKLPEQQIAQFLLTLKQYFHNIKLR